MRQTPKATTERARYVFRVKESARGAPFWIALEPYDSHLSVLGDGFLGFDLPDGTSFERAQQIARFLNDNIESVSCTTFLVSSAQE